MEKSGEFRDFSLTLSHRVASLKSRKERSEFYSNSDAAGLNQEQRQVAQSKNEITGMYDEAKRMEDLYRQYVTKKNEEDRKIRAAEFERGKAEAEAEAKQKTEATHLLLSKFLNLVSYQHELGGSSLKQDDVLALVTALNLFYAGDSAGSAAMTKLADGSNENVGSTEVSYRHLKHLVEDGIDEADELSAVESEGDSDKAYFAASSEETKRSVEAGAASTNGVRSERSKTKEEFDAEEADRSEADKKKDRKEAKSVEQRPISYADAVALGPTGNHSASKVVAKTVEKPKPTSKPATKRNKSPPKDSNSQKDSKESRDVNSSREKESKEVKDMKDAKETKDVKDKELKDKELKGVKEPKDVKDPKDTKDSKDVKEAPKDAKEFVFDDDSGFQVVDKKSRRKPRKSFAA